MKQTTQFFLEVESPTLTSYIVTRDLVWVNIVKVNLHDAVYLSLCVNKRFFSS